MTVPLLAEERSKFTPWGNEQDKDARPEFLGNIELDAQIERIALTHDLLGYTGNFDRSIALGATKEHHGFEALVLRYDFNARKGLHEKMKSR